jgi:hypothetical protein
MSDLACNITLEPALTVNLSLNAIGATPAAFLNLSDVDETTFVGKGGDMVRVKVDESGLEFGVGAYTLLPATTSVLGGVKDGDRITIAADGTISADVQTTDISGKVDKVTGSSLVADTEISKIHASGSDNQDLSGLTTAPATNTADYIPQWNGANSKTLKDGLPVPSGGLVGLDSDEIEFAIINSYRI